MQEGQMVSLPPEPVVPTGIRSLPSLLCSPCFLMLWLVARWYLGATYVPSIQGSWMRRCNSPMHTPTHAHTHSEAHTHARTHTHTERGLQPHPHGAAVGQGLSAFCEVLSRGETGGFLFRQGGRWVGGVVSSGSHTGQRQRWDVCWGPVGGGSSGHSRRSRSC